MTEQELKRLRSDFPILSTRVGREPLIYFDNAATTQKPRQVIDAISNYYRRHNANVHRAAHHLAGEATQAYEAARTIVADWLNVEAREVIWTRGATEAINLVAKAFLQPRLRSQDRILLLVSNHHANILPWQQLAQSTGAKLDVVGLTESGDLDLQQYRELLKLQPKMVALTHVSNALGSIYPVAAMVAQAREAGAWTLVDGAQALPHFDLDLHELGADFYTFSGHKTFGPTGIGVLYGRYELLDSMAPWQTGGEMIERVSFDEVHYAPPPLRFEAGTPNISGTIALAAAIEYLKQRDRLALEEHEQQLFNRAREALSQIQGVNILPAGQHTVALLSCTFDDFSVADVAAFLDTRGIAVRAGHHCAQPLLQYLDVDATLRISFAFYNSEQEVDKLVETLDEFLRGETLNDNSSAEQLVGRIYSATDTSSRFAALMQLASALPRVAPDLRQAQWEVAGCATRTWMRLTQRPGDLILLETDAQSRVMQSLLYLIAREVNGRTPSQIDPDAIEAKLKALGFESQLSHTRGNAIRNLLAHLRSLIEH